MIKWIFIGVGILFILGIIKILLSVEVTDLNKENNYSNHSQRPHPNLTAIGGA